MLKHLKCVCFILSFRLWSSYIKSARVLYYYKHICFLFMQCQKNLLSILLTTTKTNQYTKKYKQQRINGVS